MCAEIAVSDQLIATVSGGGPVLLMCPGGDGDPDAVAALAAELVDNWTVVTYQRRGYPLEAETAGIPPPTIADHADDAAAVLAAVTDAPGCVFASSFGAAVALELLLRHPARVTRLIAHEPPVAALLPEPESTRSAAEQHAMHARFRDGVGAALPLMARFAGIRLDEWEPGSTRPGPPDPSRMLALQRFFASVAPEVEHYQPDVAAIRTAAGRLVPATGTTVTGHFPYRVAEALGALIDVPVARFPGAHTGMTTHPRAFAVKLRELLGT